MAKLPELISKENVTNFLESFDAFMTDCDGVLWSGDEVLNEANIVINKLLELGKKVFLLTNNSTKSREEYAKKCSKLGFNVTKENIVSSAYVAALHLQQLDFKKKVYLLGTTGIAQELDAVGVEHFGSGPEPLLGKSFDLIDLVELDPEVGAVVVAFDPYFCLPKLLKAASYVNAVPGCLFLASNTDECFPFKGCALTYPG
ncbi:HAD-superfamily hydrolase subfamily IIA, partial [Trinorchestia longiramus]